MCALTHIKLRVAGGLAQTGHSRRGPTLVERMEYTFECVKSLGYRCRRGPSHRRREPGRGTPAPVHPARSAYARFLVFSARAGLIGKDSKGATSHVPRAGGDRPLFAHSGRPWWRLRMIAGLPSRCSAGALIDAPTGRRPAVRRSILERAASALFASIAARVSSVRFSPLAEWARQPSALVRSRIHQ